MSKQSLKIIIFLIIFQQTCFAQNVSLGISNTTRAKLEVQGGPLNVSGIFGTNQGISVGYNPAIIGFNAYGGMYMGNGYAANLQFDGTATGGLKFIFYPSGTANGTLGAATGVLTLATSTGTKILTNATTNYTLDVGRGTGVNGTAQFSGTSFSSHFNYSSNEDTYIRGGKPGSRVIFNETSGDVYMGSGSSIVGINYSNPVYTFEVRQVGGTGMLYGAPGNYSWEWRVAGSPANFYLRYADVIQAYIRPADGTMWFASDRRLKTDIQKLEPVLLKIMQLAPVTYKMKDENQGDISSIGFIAQDVAPLFPELAL